jgi:hypothetical protein
MSLIATAFGTKVALAVLSLVVVGGGTAVAAVAANGTLPALPASVQTATPTATPGGSDTATADPTPTATPTSTPDPTETATTAPSATKGPDASGPAAFGLCTAYTAGGLHKTSVANSALVNAAKSAGSIKDYCAPILEAHRHGPSTSSTQRPGSSTDHGKSDVAHGKGSSSSSHGH